MPAGRNRRRQGSVGLEANARGISSEPEPVAMRRLLTFWRRAAGHQEEAAARLCLAVQPRRNGRSSECSAPVPFSFAMGPPSSGAVDSAAEAAVADEYQRVTLRHLRQ